mgnify:CR=1 FL=1
MSYRAAIYRHPAGSETVLTGPSMPACPMKTCSLRR